MEDYSKVKVLELVSRNDDHPYILNGTWETDVAGYLKTSEALSVKKEDIRNVIRGHLDP